jgi:formylglycine-generating enzyme required for sulfatase activity
MLALEASPNSLSGLAISDPAHQWQEFGPDPYPPAWANAHGDDRFGLWADFTLPASTITQRLRWIAPGEFDMGSPPDEPERYADEGDKPRRVQISQGFWLLDTACTQALWQAVMDENPAHFNEHNKGGPQHPVERVSWLKVQDFLVKVAALLPGLSPDFVATLPTEAEWEYACRAGSTTPFSFGNNIDTDQVNYHGGHPYADAAKGEVRGSTVAVKALPANAWGCYQMHGNVWEWCADAREDFFEKLQPLFTCDPGLAAALFPLAGNQPSIRVVRGGSWCDGARGAGSACRVRFAPDSRFLFLGFRFVLRTRGQAKPGF